MQRTLGLALLAALLVAGCGIPVTLRTQPAPISACDDALASGMLVSSPTSGLGLRVDVDLVQDVEWPFEYTARRDLNGIVLVDSAGVEVAREGQFIQMGGGTDNAGVFHACPASITVVPGPKATPES